MGGNGQDTADALIAAGRRLFARQGYDGTSVRAITAEAGVNLGAITYHFGSKRELYERVVRSCLSALVDRVEAVVRGGGPVLDRAESVVSAYFDYLNERPELPQLLMQELAVGRVPPVGVLEPMRRLLQLLSGLVREGQAVGEVRAGDPTVLGISIVSQAVHLSLVRQPLTVVAGLDLDDPEVRGRVARAVALFVRGGLAWSSASEGGW